MRSRSASSKRPSLWLFHHPQRGAILMDTDVPPEGRRIRGGIISSEWREVARVEMIVENGQRWVEPSQRPPKGFLWGDPKRQVYGLNGAALVFGPIEKTCRDCRAPFVLTAHEQKHMAETLRLPTMITSVRCRACRRAKLELERARKAYADALGVAARTPTAATHLEVARTALAVISAGGRAPLDKAVAHCRRARSLGAAASADRIEQQIEKLRAARMTSR